MVATISISFDWLLILIRVPKVRFSFFGCFLWLLVSVVAANFWELVIFRNGITATVNYALDPIGFGTLHRSRSRFVISYKILSRTLWRIVPSYNKFMWIFAGHVLSTIEKSDLNQALSRKRPSSRWDLPDGVVSARRASPCLSRLTLLGAVSLVLASSLPSSFLAQNIPSVYSYLY